MRLSIRLKLLFLTLGVITLVGGSISLYAINIGKERLTKAFMSETLEIATFLSANMANEIYDLDVFSLRLQLKNAHMNKDLLDTYVLGCGRHCPGGWHG